MQSFTRLQLLIRRIWVCNFWRWSKRWQCY